MNRYLIAALLACAVLIASGWQKIQRQGEQIDHQAAAIETLERATESRRNTIKLLSDLETQHTQERERANQTNASLRADVAAGQRRLSVLAKCPVVRADANPGLDAAEARAELNPAAAERIISVGPDGDDAIRQLNALIDTVRTVCPGAAQ